MPRALAVVFLCFVCCASPARRFDRMAGSLGLARDDVVTAGFRHAIFMAPGTVGQASGAALHVYLADDGSPWLGGNRVTRDPTPRNPLTLELMARDPGPAVLVGRPCYHRRGTDRACNPLLWTHRRYSPAVVESLALAIGEILRRQGRAEVDLFGYSGGGVLAMLVAERLPQTRTVVTVASNLDTDAWCELHGYTPLEGSLNPARRPPLPAGVRQLHLAGGRDRVVPADLVEAFARERPVARSLELPKADHTCCWAEIWPRILDWVAAPGDAAPLLPVGN